MATILLRLCLRSIENYRNSMTQAKEKTLDLQGFRHSMRLIEIVQWRRRDLNPRPETLTLKLLRVYLAYLGFA